MARKSEFLFVDPAAIFFGHREPWVKREIAFVDPGIDDLQTLLDGKRRRQCCRLSVPIFIAGILE